MTGVLAHGGLGGLVVEGGLVVIMLGLLVATWVRARRDGDGDGDVDGE